MNGVPRWRIVAAVLVLACLLGLLGVFAPYYFRNMALQNYVSGLTHNSANQQKSDDALRGAVLDKAHELNLPVSEGNVHITHSGETLHIDVRYAVRVNLPGYTVDLHFYPGAGSR